MSIEENFQTERFLTPARYGLLLVAMAAVLWSTAGYFTRAVPVEFPALLFWRGFFGAATTFVFVVIGEGRNTLRTFASLGRIGLLFCLYSGCAMACFIAALKLTSVAHVSIIYACVPFITAVLAWCVMRERVSLALILASLMALSGVVVTESGAIGMGGSGEGSILGDLFALIMTIMVAGFTVLRRRFPEVPLGPATCFSALLPALAALPFVTAWPADGAQFSLLAAFGISNMGLALLFFTTGAKFIPAAQTALISAIETPLAPLWVWLVFRETPTAATLIGGAVVLFAVLGHVLWENGGRGR